MADSWGRRQRRETVSTRWHLVQGGSTRQWARWWMLLLSIPSSLACGPTDHQCSLASTSEGLALGSRVESGEQSGEVVLGSDLLTETRAFDAVLDKLPKVWVGAEPVAASRAIVDLELFYDESEPEGAELPPVTVTLTADRDDQQSFEPATVSAQLGGTSSATGAGMRSLAVTLFEVCSRDSQTHGCCVYGSTKCAGRATLELSRSDDLFPRVHVAYSVRASANVYECIEGEPTATWSLEAE